MLARYQEHYSENFYNLQTKKWTLMEPLIFTFHNKKIEENCLTNYVKQITWNKSQNITNHLVQQQKFFPNNITLKSRLYY